MITQCPACQTMFRVVADQLRISDGWVRCGQCSEIFDANAHLEQQDAVQPPAVPGAPIGAKDRVDAGDSAAAAAPRTAQGGAQAVGGTAAAADDAVDTAPEPARRAAAASDTAPRTAPQPEHPVAIGMSPHVETASGRGARAVPDALDPDSDASSGRTIDDSAASGGGTEASWDAVADARHDHAPALDASMRDPATDEPRHVDVDLLLDDLGPADPLGGAAPPPSLEPEPPLRATAADAELGPAVEVPLPRRPDASDWEPPPPSAAAGYAPGAGREPSFGDAAQRIEPLADPKVEPAWALATTPPASKPARSRNSGEPAWYAEFRQSMGGAAAEPGGEPPLGADEPLEGVGLDDMRFVREARHRAFWQRPLVRGLLALLALLLALLLAVQMAVTWRDRIAALQPQLVPLLELLCRPTGCTVGVPRQIESIVIDSSAFNRLGPESYRLAFTLRNQAAFALALPSMELTLTDAGDQPVLRRVFSPAELGAGPSDVLAAAGDWSANVDMTLGAEVTGGRIAGYRLVAFYP
ncbi:DUF3426 domain-containing protein [Ramlibacter sp. AN1015]|uniref:DUF3426 domain-containing protein n=1 Tax=Ramlibacter sp. AN1015 TaxID=3133428 RepID=UPI0030BF5A58